MNAVARTLGGLFLLSLLVAACAPKVDDVVASMTRHTMEFGGLEREYFVFLPSIYDGKTEVPVTIFMHGYGGSATGTEAEVTQGLNTYAENYGYVMVYPQGTWFKTGDTPEAERVVTSWNHISDGFDTGPAGPTCSIDAVKYPCPPECGTCGRCGWTSCHDDIGFLKSLIATITVDVNAGRDSIFVSGFSNGSVMANRIACEASELFAAVALFGGGPLERGFECTPKKSLPLLQVNGGQDLVYPFDGRKSNEGWFVASAASTEQYWLAEASCDTSRKQFVPPPINGKDVQCTIACGETDHPAINCFWADGNHRWPGTDGFVGSNGNCVSELQAASMPKQAICLKPDRSADIWGSRLMFEFFDEHRQSR